MENPQIYSDRVQFNEGVLQANRVGEAQQDINKIRGNLKAFNLEYNCYNYEIWFNFIRTLVNENSKLKDVEKKELYLLQEIIKMRLLLYPPHKSIKKLDSRHPSTKFVLENWLVIEDLLEKYERYARKGLDLSGLGNPNMEGDGLF